MVFFLPNNDKAKPTTIAPIAVKTPVDTSPVSGSVSFSPWLLVTVYVRSLFFVAPRSTRLACSPVESVATPF